MDDVISRQAAIDEIDEWIKAFLENGHKESAADACLIQDGIIQLPSAQPEPSQAARDIATILENEKDMRVIKKNAESESCADTISRKAAIDAILAVTGNSSVRELYEHVQEHGLSDMWSGGVNAAIDIIIAVPSAQPEPLDEWCTDCKEYDHERHCCPRWNRVIRQTLKDMKEEQPESEPIDPNERDIEILSALRSKYCCFDEKEERVYHALSESIKAINSLEQSGKENR